MLISHGWNWEISSVGSVLETEKQAGSDENILRSGRLKQRHSSTDLKQIIDLVLLYVDH